MPSSTRQLSPQNVHARAVRMLALADLAGRLEIDDPGLPGKDEATDDADKLRALLAALKNELEELHAEAAEAIHCDD